MSEHQNEDDTTPLEYLISGLVVLLFGLLYFFINHGKDFMSGSDGGALSLAAPAVVANAETGVGNKLLTDNNGDATMPSADDAGDEDGAEDPETVAEAVISKLIRSLTLAVSWL